MSATAGPPPVLIVMENDGLRAIVEQLLQTVGHATRITDVMADIEPMLRARSAGAVVLDADWCCPNGLAEFQMLRARGGGRTRFVVVAKDPLCRQKGLIRPGMDILLTPPFTLRHMTSAVARALQPRPRRADIQLRGLPA